VFRMCGVPPRPSFGTTVGGVRASKAPHMVSRRRFAPAPMHRAAGVDRRSSRSPAGSGSGTATISSWESALRQPFSIFLVRKSRIGSQDTAPCYAAISQVTETYRSCILRRRPAITTRGATGSLLYLLVSYPDRVSSDSRVPRPDPASISSTSLSCSGGCSRRRLVVDPSLDDGGLGVMNLGRGCAGPSFFRQLSL
jgi:hypothetical protein